MVWYFHLLKNFPQFIVIHTVKGFGIVNKAEIGVFLELPCFFDDPEDVGNLISGSSAFSKSSLNIWNFMVKCERKGALLSPPRSPSNPHRGPCQGKQVQVLTQALKLFAGEEGAGSQDKLGPEGRALPAHPSPPHLGGLRERRAGTARSPCGHSQAPGAPGLGGLSWLSPGLCAGPAPARLFLRPG